MADARVTLPMAELWLVWLVWLVVTLPSPH